MDFINVRDEECFRLFEQKLYMDSCADSESPNSCNLEDDKNLWDWDEERRLNGDYGLLSMNFDSETRQEDDFHEFYNDWQQFSQVNPPDVLLSDTLPLSPSDSDLDSSNFDLPTFVTDDRTPETEHKKPKVTIQFGGKKLDLKAQRYVTEEEDEDHVDVETVSENESPTVLEAGDVDSLLEQFEATEKLPIAEKSEQVAEVKNEKVDKNKTANEDNKSNKQILEALPDELIKRIRESGKRKTISVIPAIPNKKRCVRAETKTSSKVSNLANTDVVNLDHDYCKSPNPYPKHPKKDSGFGSADEEERMVLMNQPTVKNADGTLMVSLLKANTIKSNTEVKGKKKLNLAEYKKRKNLNVIIKTEESTVEAKKTEEDENIRRQKHQEKLMKMAEELLNSTPAKSSKPVAEKTRNNKIEPPKRIIVQPSKPVDMDVMTTVSIGTNTEVSIAPVVEEIKPLLKSAKINTNSLITSVIGNIPKVVAKPVCGGSSKEAVTEHGENKTIVYLPKDRPRPVTCDVAIQTEMERISRANSRERTRHRKRSSSRSSGSSRYSTSESYSVYSSPSSSECSSRSRSRSNSPRRNARQPLDRRRMEEVEERRVVYVGRISSTTTRDELRRRFQRFGPITRISVHFRERGDNYGFVTFVNKLDAFEAIERGNDEPFYPKYDLSFGGRRAFCKTSYSDLDNMREEVGFFQPRPVADDSFDNLLRIAQENLRKRKL